MALYKSYVKWSSLYAHWSFMKWLPAAIIFKLVTHAAFKAMAANSIAASAVVIDAPIAVVVISMVIIVAITAS